jgi:hypothetical protein
VAARRLALTACVLALAALSPAAASARVSTPLGVGAWQWYLHDSDFRHLHAAGVSLYRTPIRWELVEPRDGRWSFRHYDLMFAAAARTHIRVAPLLSGDPLVRSPAGVALFARYARVVAGRYGRHGSFWRSHPRLPQLPATSFEIWNEENDPNYWSGPPSPFAYFRLLRAAHTALHAVVPRARVVFGGTAVGGLDANQFLTTVLSVGGARYFEDYAMHAYFPDPPSLLAAVELARRTLDRGGAHRAGIVVSEFGWPSVPTGQTTVEQAEQEQAARLSEAVTLVDKQRDALGVRAMDWFAYRDMNGDLPEEKLGLFAANGEPKPVWWALRALTGPAAG